MALTLYRQGSLDELAEPAEVVPASHLVGIVMVGAGNDVPLLRRFDCLEDLPSQIDWDDIVLCLQSSSSAPQGPAPLIEAIPDLFEFAGDEGVSQVCGMEVEVERPLIPKPSLDGDESLPPE